MILRSPRKRPKIETNAAFRNARRFIFSKLSDRVQIQSYYIDCTCLVFLLPFLCFVDFAVDIICRDQLGMGTLTNQATFIKNQDLISFDNRRNLLSNDDRRCPLQIMVEGFGPTSQTWHPGLRSNHLAPRL